MSNGPRFASTGMGVHELDAALHEAVEKVINEEAEKNRDTIQILVPPVVASLPGVAPDRPDRRV